MADLFWLTRAQLGRIASFFPLSHGVPRVDYRRVISGILHVIRNGLRWRDAPDAHGPQKTLYNRFVCWSQLDIFNRIFSRLAGQAGEPNGLMIDGTHLKAHRTAASLLQRGAFRHLGRTKGGLNSKLHAVCNGLGRPVVLLLSAGQMSDHKGARLVLEALSAASSLIADRGYGSRAFREALAAKGIAPCLPPRLRAGRSRSRTTRRSTASATRSRTCSAA